VVGVDSIGDAVYDGIRRAAVTLRSDVCEAMGAALARERSERGRVVLEQLLENAEAAARDGVPLCQDTGTVWVWVELGASECLGSPLQPAVDEAVRRAYADGGLRMSVVRDGLLDRTNTGDNTPAFLDVTMREGHGATVHVMLKGGGSDNASAVSMLPPSAGADGVREFVVRTVEEKAASACPPLVLGVGVGGTFDTVAKLAKKALLRRLDARPADAGVYAFEQELLAAVNATGIGPAGLGGDTTALGVSLMTAPCHIAALPVAVNLGCSAVRTAVVELV
jgi:tartrate/fumarate subfamily iron-sulfur-dependent hydro-lyase alpha chain